MKNILILLLLIPFFGFAQIQDEYYRVSDWTFLPDSVVQLTDTTYSIYAVPANYNDPGAVDRIVGNYVVDFIGHRYLVVDSTDTFLTIYDIYKTGQAPQTGQIAHCYRSVGGGEADFIGSVDYSTLDASARWKINGADNELMWQKVKTKVPYLGAESDVDLGENSISADTFKLNNEDLYLNHLILTPENNGKIARQQGDSVEWGKELDSVYLVETDTANIPDKEKYFWSAEKKWLPITSSVANGASAPLYFTNINSDISGYKKTSYTNDVAISTFSATTSQDTVLVEEFLYDSGLGTSIIDAGVWSIRTFCKISGAIAVSKIMYEVFVRDDEDSILFSFYSDEINNTDFQYNDYSFVGNAINLQKTTYRLGIKVYFLTTSAAAITLDFRVGDGETTYANVPLALRHDQLRDKNGNPAYLHVTFQDTALINQLRRDSANFVTYTGNDRDLDMGANSISTDTVKLDGVPLLLNTFKQGNLGGASNIFYSTGASSQPASGSINQVIGGNGLIAGNVPYFNGTNLANTNSYFDGTNIGIGTTAPNRKLQVVGGFNIQGGGLYTSYTSDGLWGATATPNYLSTNSDFINPGRLILGYQDNGAGLYGPAYAFEVKHIDGLLRDIEYYSIIMKDTEDSSIPFFITNKGRAFFKNNVGINKTDPSESLDVNGNAIADVLKSRVPTGTPPLVVASTTKVDSLNAGLFDGKKASDFQLKSDTTTFDATLSDLADSASALRILANTKAIVSGSTNRLVKITGSNTLGNSLIQDNGIAVSIGLPVQNNNAFQSINNIASVGASESGGSEIGAQTYGYWNTPTYTGTLLRQYGSSYTGTIAGISAKNLGALIFQNTDTSYIYTNGLSPIIMGTLSSPKSILNIDGNYGVGTLTPAARIHSQSTTTQLRLGYDATKYTDLSTGSTGNLTIDPTGDTTKVVGAVNSTGGFFKNGVEITGGSGSMVYPINSGIVQFNGTTWGTSITNNSNLWNNAYDKKIVSAAFSGTSTKTLTLYQQDGNVLQAAFTDESGGTTNWSTDTYGLYYTAGKVGVGANSDVNTWLNVGSLTSTNIGVYGKSQTNPGVRGSSVDYTGVFGSSTDQYGVYGVSTNGYGGGFDKGINLPSGNLDIQGQTRISQGGFFQPVSSSDASAPNNSIYYSTTQSKLVYKNASGTVNVLY